jgi:hypothetical protein
MWVVRVRVDTRVRPDSFSQETICVNPRNLRIATLRAFAREKQSA